MACTNVWSNNLVEEFRKLDSCLNDYRVVSFDTEFPGFLASSPRDCGDVRRYADLKCNVDAMNMLQLGLTPSNMNGEIGGTWQFNFFFSRDLDVYSEDSIVFLKKSGIDFVRLETDGIDLHEFSTLLTSLLGRHSDLLWVNFHGLYDLGYLVKLLSNNLLPESITDFTRLIGECFGGVVDVKYVARLCDGLLEGELSLEKLANILGVERVGGAHQAGSDSLLTCLVFNNIMMTYNELQPTDYIGHLYSIQTRICMSQKQPLLRVQPPPNTLLRVQPPPNIIYFRAAPRPIIPIVCSPYRMRIVRMKPVHTVLMNKLLL
ncbi:putative CCR4-associated factor 1 homolog 8 [Mercurialis annua]|uniref:putative CCR4-associated factor 1 homolog 8 n=1 Tax=Mercurialis annua TaxID=3986 RepID=UPI0021607EA8|nr:putative CCR4-associated factor 1 homolog 8 [Mercurialis annua]